MCLFAVFVGFGNTTLIYFFENRSRVWFVLSSCCCLVFSVVENPEAATLSQFSGFLLRLCKAGHVLQPKDAEH